ncbi:hypothetical protein O6H91_10G056200 [Diphasiastrum complanatum]|uniref:Uncharacterized protein n=1 Tax=Diphasiastrum complanatum TaxID=34168 RepID=A0ACC2CH54_DIPCM|nr:hypothetical protein O6H91_10G056200 [Diphasiastrum complanatum]
MGQCYTKQEESCRNSFLKAERKSAVRYHPPRHVSSATTSGFTRKSSHLMKEYKSRFCLFRRCVVILICWHE